MEANLRYFCRRATEELTAASRAVTPEARARRVALARSFLLQVEQASDCPKDSVRSWLGPAAKRELEQVEGAAPPLLDWARLKAHCRG